MPYYNIKNINFFIVKDLKQKDFKYKCISNLSKYDDNII